MFFGLRKRKSLNEKQRLINRYFITIIIIVSGNVVNRREKEVLEKYESEGWKTVRCGAPDFLFIKVKDCKIVNFCFVEVKPLDVGLSYEQEIWKKVLESLGARYKLDAIL